MAEIAVKITDIANFLGGKISGDKNLIIRGFKPLSNAGPDDLSFFEDLKLIKQLRNTKAGAVLINESAEAIETTKITVNSPHASFAKILQHFGPKPPSPFEGQSEKAFISPDAEINESARIGPGVYIGPKVLVGAQTEIWPGVSIGPNCKIGSNCKIYANVSIYFDCIIGNNVILHAGVVIGADGFGFAPSGLQYLKIPQIGNVIIEDNVEIGANSTVDRAAMGSTVIGNGTKIDNLVMVAHNCKVGSDSILVSQVGVSGSTTMGKHVILAGQSGVCGHLEIGDFTQVGAQSGVTKNLDSGKQYIGSPAIPANEFKRINAYFRKLPDFYKKIKLLEKQVEELKREKGVEDKDNP